MEKKEILQRILLIGDSGVGKTSILEKYINNNFPENYKASKGMDYKTKIITFEDGNIIKFQIWDTSGHERFLSITKTYYKAANGFILIYDVNKEDSFINLNNWIEDIKKENKEAPIIIVANKIDDEGHRTTKNKWGKFWKKRELLFYECSAKSGVNVENIFNEIFKRIKEKNQNKKEDKKKQPNCYIY